MADTKPGKVIRVDPVTWKVLQGERSAGESTTACVRRLLGLPARKTKKVEAEYVLPSDVYPTIEDARGAAVLRKVRSRSKEIEEPIPVRKVWQVRG